MNEDKICRDGDGGRNLGEQLIHTLVASPSLVDHLRVTLKHGERDVMEERPEHFGPPEKHTVPRGVSGHWALTAVPSLGTAVWALGVDGRAKPGDCCVGTGR